LSKIIKASQITGEYQLNDYNYLKKIMKKKEESAKYKQNKHIDKSSNTEDEICKERIVIEAEKRADQIIEEAKNVAEDIKKQAKEFIEEAQKDGFEDGYQSGFQKGNTEGYQQGLKEYKQLIAHFDDIIIKTRDELTENIDVLNRDVISLAVKISSKVLNSELKVNPTIINSIVKDMIKDLTDIDDLTIYISTELMEYIDKDKFKSDYTKNIINFSADNQLEPGDCIVETRFGGKDGTINNKLLNIERELLKGAGFYEED